MDWRNTAMAFVVELLVLELMHHFFIAIMAEHSFACIVLCLRVLQILNQRVMCLRGLTERRSNVNLLYSFPTFCRSPKTVSSQ